MGPRRLFAAATLAVAFAATPRPAAQDAQTSGRTFKSGIDVIAIDVAVVDKQGKPVEDLRAGDFTVKVDGRNRPIVSAQLIKVDRTVIPSADPADTLISTNAVVDTGRRVVIAVDQTLIVPGSIAPLMRTASRFVEKLAPADRAAVLAFPEPGPRVDFTTDKDRVRDAIQNIVGQPAKVQATTFNLSIQEALAINRSERTVANAIAGTFEQTWATLGPNMRRVLERGCRDMTVEQLREPQNLTELQRCIRDLVNEAIVEAQEVRTDATMTLRRLQAYLRELAALDGPKTMILISAGIVAEDQALVDDVARLAADARTTVNVVTVDRERERDRTDLPNNQSSMPLQDRALGLAGLTPLVDISGGVLYRAIGPAEGVFDRMALEMSASYLVAVERRPGDPDRQRIEIDVKRRGVTVRSPRTVTTMSAVNARRPMEDVLRDALASALPIPEVPLRLSTFVRREASTYRLHLAAQIGQPGASGEFAVGCAVIDQQDRVVLARANHVQLTSGGAGERLQYDMAVDVPSGVFSVRFGVVDSGGRRGTAVRRVEVGAPAGRALATSDLIVGPPPRDGDTIHPSVEPRVDGRIAAYLELYPPDGGGRMTVTLEIAEGESSPALKTASLNVGDGAQPSWRIASGAVDLPLPPGRYVARASVRRDDAGVLVVSRPFILEKGADVAAATERASAAPLPTDARGRTAVYVSAFVRGLSNVVGQEDFALSGPDRRVTSDFLLVQHPASPGDLLTYREVTHVNGVAVPGRQERLADLFLKPVGLVRDRVRQITLASEQYVPALLNPLYVLVFLQADFQPRFELTVKDAGREWPSTVKAVEFVEVGRPTILRGGPAGDIDVPVHGTAWIEPGTGRVVQTELLVNTRRATTVMTTKFVLDRRLQIMVPERMQTKNPNGVATYSNFRRFTVQATSAINKP